MKKLFLTLCLLLGLVCAGNAQNIEVQCQWEVQNRAVYRCALHL